MRTRKEFNNTLGNPDYFTIIGHTPVNDEKGCIYNKKENYLNIDGGCGPYTLCAYEYDHVPLLEIENEKITVLTFSHSNELLNGNYFINNRFIPIEKNVLDEKKILLKRK